jgi:acetoin utilization deacetylase AcuC-like enzyme
MKIIYHPRFAEVYDSDPAAAAGRMEAILHELPESYEIIEPEPATIGDLLKVHTLSHIQSIKKSPLLYEIACLSAGGAITSARLALEGEITFGLIRPPGHHASPDYCWGFCSFNNIAIAVAVLQAENLIENAFILDFDLHFGDGTNRIFEGSSVTYFQPRDHNRAAFLAELTETLKKAKKYSIMAVSAGFDRHIDDWGGQLTTDDYYTIGSLVKEAALTNCQGRRFAILEGGYTYSVLGKNMKAFLEGMA